MDQPNAEHIVHAGVKGMKWGKRKGSVASSTDRKRSVDSISKRPARSLSNKQLKAASERLQLEKKYKDLNPGVLSKGQKKVATVLAVGGAVTGLYNLANSPAAKDAIKIIKLATKTNATGRHL